VREIFSVIDKDNSGTIEKEELRSVISHFGGITESEVGAFFGTKEHIEFAEFVSFLQTQKNEIFASKLLSPLRVVFCVGGPGSGKGTICGALCKQSPNLKHVSSGDLLRKEIAKGSELGLMVQKKIENGELISASIVMGLLESMVSSSSSSVILLDGFPRSMENVHDFLSLYQNVESILYFQCGDEEMIRRIVERGKRSGRSDDNAETAKKRIAVFKEQSTEPIKYVEELGVPRINVDTLQSIEHNVSKLLEIPLFAPERKT
jgi:adenylate kinase family enzyme